MPARPFVLLLILSAAMEIPPRLTFTESIVVTCFDSVSIWVTSAANSAACELPKSWASFTSDVGPARLEMTGIGSLMSLRIGRIGSTSELNLENTGPAILLIAWPTSTVMFENVTGRSVPNSAACDAAGPVADALL